jgi:hypothetical protein
MTSPWFTLQVLCAAGVLGMSAACAQDVSQKPAEGKGPGGGFAIPTGWSRRGLVLERQHKDKGVSGDPCIVWDDAIQGWRMVLFYMGYPQQAQRRRISPFGSAQGAATQKLDEKVATKRGVVQEPCQQAGHWASGWVGGLQLLRGQGHRWVAVVNASPTAPDPGTKTAWTEEPPPSQGGFAWCDEAWPVQGWHFAAEPIEWVKDIPQSALDAGEGYNLWRQFIHLLPDGRAALFYNSGYYGREQLYMKVSDRP